MILSRRQLQDLFREYQPLSFENFVEQSGRFRVPMHHCLKNRSRFCLVLGTAQMHFPQDPFTAVDLGTYPGSLLRLLRLLMSPDQCHLIGVGLMISDEFTRAMKEDCKADIYRVNLDPQSEAVARKGDLSRIPIGDGQAQLAFALEVIEHLVSPTHLLSEAFRILAPGGRLYVTTPNVTRIGNVFKLLIGRSNFDRLLPVDYDRPDDEWRPHFREYTLPEVQRLLENAGFEVAESLHFLGHDTRYNIKTLSEQLIECVKQPFYLIPHLRTNLFMVGRKPAGRIISMERDVP